MVEVVNAQVPLITSDIAPGTGAQVKPLTAVEQLQAALQKCSSDIMGSYVAFLRSDLQETAVFKSIMASLETGHADQEFADLSADLQMKYLHAMLSYQLNLSRNLSQTVSAALARLGQLQSDLNPGNVKTA